MPNVSLQPVVLAAHRRADAMAQAREAEADMVIAIRHALDDLVNAGARGNADGLHLSKVAALVALRAALGTRRHLDEAVQTVLQFETEGAL